MSETKLTVYHDGGCPLCRREIAFYRRLEGAGEIRWVDVRDAGDEELGAGLDRASALARFHVRDPQGGLMSGGPAFAALWRALPRFHGLGRLLEAPGLRWLSDRVYDAFLAIRPALQRLAARLG